MTSQTQAAALYDSIGISYRRPRRPDPRDASLVLDVGA